MIVRKKKAIERCVGEKRVNRLEKKKKDHKVSIERGNQFTSSIEETKVKARKEKMRLVESCRIIKRIEISVIRFLVKEDRRNITKRETQNRKLMEAVERRDCVGMTDETVSDD